VPKNTPEQSRRYLLRAAYNMSEEDYEEWMHAQDGCCAICQRPPEKNRRLAIDHDHKTGAVRGLLCTRCNVGLGQFGDKTKLLSRALDYLTGKL